MDRSFILPESIIRFPHSISGSFYFFLPLFFPGYLGASPTVVFIVFTPSLPDLSLLLYFSIPLS